MNPDDIATPSPLPGPDDDNVRRQAVVNAAMGELGQQDPAKYWSNVLPGSQPWDYPHDWCGGFTLWTLHQAGLAQSIEWKTGLGYCYRLPMTMAPRPGDIAYFDKPYQHHAIVVSVNGDTLHTVDGNQPGQSVKARSRSIAETHPIFYSIEPLLNGTMLA
jgi:hypothetical protein